MGENSSGKWYTNSAIIGAGAVIVAAIITGVFTIISDFMNNKNNPVVQPPPPPQVSTTTTVIVTPVPSFHLPSDASENDMTKKTASEPTVIEPAAPIVPIRLESPAQSKEETPVGTPAELPAIFQDDFEGDLRNWAVKRYSGYNNFMRWHISEKEHFSGRSSLALGHEDTDKKENNDTVHIETREELLVTENAVLSFQIKKEYRINLEIVKKKDAPFKERKIKFYPGNTLYKEWRAEEIPLGLEIDEGRYTLMLKAWDQGSLYLDDIKIQN
ncbi:MAG: hypothetical protein D3906_00320 [Candidatus Electrothrix sp. AUS1_2]|nr:hypothetical protein [Candidatus Electrothrix sp. AUS1_2]